MSIAESSRRTATAFKWNSSLTRWIDAMLIADYFPEFGTDLITALASCGRRTAGDEGGRGESSRLATVKQGGQTSGSTRAARAAHEPCK